MVEHAKREIKRMRVSRERSAHRSGQTGKGITMGVRSWKLRVKRVSRSNALVKVEVENTRS